METLSANMVRQLLEQGEVVETLSKLIAQKVIERLLQCQFKMMLGHPQTPQEAVKPSLDMADRWSENSTAVQQSTEGHESFIFSKKAQKEGKIPLIIQSLQKSVQGRKDKTRAFVSALRSWQQEGFIDANYNARVMYDELEKMMPLAFGYEVFRKYYNGLL